MTVNARGCSRPAMPALTLLRPSASRKVVAGGYQAPRVTSTDIILPVHRLLRVGWLEIAGGECICARSPQLDFVQFMRPGQAHPPCDSRFGLEFLCYLGAA